ncbi:MAG: 4Fe-4S dicluster domain-containing protein, partial [Candidatus Brocadiales bacterium]|nr:4Fe-4S dicluster domain-containing protein [Candidatus Bathyanammoxibius sp.]
SGVTHALMFFGFTVLFIGTCLIALQLHLGWKILYGNFYLCYSFTLDVFGALFLVGVLLAAYRHYLSGEEFLENRRDDAIVLGLLLVILITGFLVEGARIAATQPVWAIYSPVGYAYSLLIIAVFSGGDGPASTITTDKLLAIHTALWWLHMTLAMVFLAYIPYSKLLHIFTAPLNIFLRSAQPEGALRPLDLPDIETEAAGDVETETQVFGVLSPEDFTWKQLLDVDACMRCGRCDAQCPATLAEKPLKPQKIILDIRSQMEEDMAGRLPGGKISDAEIWACTTCRACVRHCPVNIEHLQKIIDLRRGAGLMEGKYPAEVTGTIKKICTRKNPYGLDNARREDWTEGLSGIKRLSEGGGTETPLLFWVGCAGAFDDRNSRTTQAFARVLKEMKVDFGILGAEEICCGDPLRRFGDEMDFQQFARQNTELLEKYNVKDIVTCCPHCFNTLKNEYPQFGGDFNVLHHTEFIAKNLAQTKHLLTKKTEAGLAGKTVTYHDPCYLGRHNIIYNEPREIISHLADTGHFKEMELTRCRSFCCGGGGGHMWMEQKIGGNLNEMRTDQALETGADIIATACPYCLTMLSNGLKTRDREDVKVVDIIELLAGS